MEIRRERPADHVAVAAVHRAAFARPDADVIALATDPNHVRSAYLRDLDGSMFAVYRFTG